MSTIIVTILTGCGSQGSSFYAGGTVRSGQPIDSVTAELADGQSFDGAPQPVPEGYDWYFLFSGVPDDSYTLTVTAIDSVGRQGSSSCPVSVSTVASTA